MSSLKGWKYQTSEAIIFPYNAEVPTDGFPEDFLVQMYFLSRNSGVIPILFGGMSGVMTLNRFISYSMNKPMLVGAIKGEGQKLETCAYAWLYNVEGSRGARKAFCGFTFFRPFWGRREVRTIAKMALQYWFKDLEVDVLFGTVARTNRIAQNFASKLGFDVSVSVPNWFIHNGQFRDGVLASLTKVKFLASELQNGWT